MELSFAQTYLSLTDFHPIELPQFVLVTGPNGAGKSHLLQAINNGSIRTNVATAQYLGHEIRLFDWNTLIPSESGPYSSEALRRERENAKSVYCSLRQNPTAMEPLRTLARNWTLPREYLDDPSKLVGLSSEELGQFLQPVTEIDPIQEQIHRAAVAAGEWMMSQTDENTRSTWITASETAGKPIICLDPKDIDSARVPNWGRADLFQQSFARIFVAYRDAKLSNLLAEFQHVRGVSGLEYLPEEEFVKLYGPPPWDFVNETLKSANLGFEINSPDPLDFTSYIPQLKKLSSGVVIPFSSLSSGEKILMSLAFCVYFANDKRQISLYPKLLLFDEIDAPLHPSMTKSLIDTITETLVGKFDISVIATTHSPSTVAMAPESSIYVMRADCGGLLKLPKSDALNILTVGVPTLAISFDGRRQVFVESAADARTYDTLYRAMKTLLPAGRSLEFIATGGSTNVGCSVVKRLVGDLVSAGNQSVFGLIDHDAQNVGDDRIAILGSGERNGLENFILDPLLVASAICRDAPQSKSLINIDEQMHFPRFSTQSPLRLQNFVDSVCDRVFKGIGDTTEVGYLGGFSLFIDSRWLHHDDHKLEGLILDAFPFLREISKNQAGRLMQRIIATVIAEQPNFLPKAVFETLEDLLQKEAHI